MRSARRISAPTRITTTTTGLARLAFGAEAHCTVGGGSDELSEVVTRWEPDVLMRQVSGESLCTSQTNAPVETFCDRLSEPCSVKIRSRGTFLTQLPPAPEAVASLTESFRRRARIVVCSGFVRISADGSEAVGQITGRNRFVIVVDETVERLEDETVTPNSSSSVSSESSSTEITVIGTMPGPGRCASSFVQEQERSLKS